MTTARTHKEDVYELHLSRSLRLARTADEAEHSGHDDHLQVGAFRASCGVARTSRHEEVQLEEEVDELDHDEQDQAPLRDDEPP